MAARRTNLTIEEQTKAQLQSFADRFYGGNLSRFLVDAGLFYAGALEAEARAGREATDAEQ